MKNDYQMLLTILLAAALLVAADPGAFMKAIGVELAGDTEPPPALARFRDSEKAFWETVKGTRSNAGDIDALYSENPAATLPPNADARRDSKLSGPVKFLLVGDSMMLVGFGPALENTLVGYREVSVVREGVYSTGLNRVDYFDWYAKTAELIAQHKPDVVVVMFGGNDGQGIVDRQKVAHEFGTDAWKDVYRQRVALYLARVAPHVKRLYWVGHPITGNEGFLVKFQTMNPIYREECAKVPNAVFVDTWDRFAVNGAYRQSIPDDNGLWQIAKQSDGVHVTDFGGRILSGLVMKSILNDVDIRK